MRIVLLLAILGLGACSQQPARDANNPQPPAPQANPSVAVLPVPPAANIPSGQQQYFCTAAIGPC
jgi:hypothetical protein